MRLMRKVGVPVVKPPGGEPSEFQRLHEAVRVVDTRRIRGIGPVWMEAVSVIRACEPIQYLLSRAALRKRKRLNLWSEDPFKLLLCHPTYARVVTAKRYFI